MIIIGIAGAHSGSGKTKVAELVLKELTKGDKLSFSAVKKWGAIKYTRTELYWSVIDSEDVINTDNKDTARLLSAGAEKVVWVKSPPEGLQEAIPIALNALGDIDGVVVEGNSIVEFLSPTIVVFLHPREMGTVKPSTYRLIEKADIVVMHPSSPAVDLADEDSFKYTLTGQDTLDQKELIRIMDDVFVKKEIKNRLSENSKNGRISCKEARTIAEELSVPYRIVGEIADELKIKIFACELGCF